jgi:bacterioferritin-associated ferredoxin
MRPSSGSPAVYICVCQAISDQDIRRAVAAGAHTFENVQAATGCTTCCGCCEDEARQLVQDTVASETRDHAIPALA